MNFFLNSFIQPIHLLPILLLFLVIPILSIAYYKYRTAFLWHCLMIYSFLFYLLIIFIINILPLPTFEKLATLQPPNMQLQPFHFITAFQSAASISLKSPQIYRPIVSLLLTIPFGIYLKNYFNQSFGTIIGLTLFLSIFIAFTQLTGIFGIYPYAYHSFDIDDVLLHLLGGFLGGLIAYPLRLFIPKDAELDTWKITDQQIVSLPRRLIGALIDTSLCLSIILIISFFMQLFDYSLFMTLGLLFVYHIISIYLTNGITLGKKIVKIAIVPLEGNYLTFQQIFKRYLILFVYYPLGIYLTSFFISKMFIARMNIISMIGAGLFFFVLIFLPIIVMIHFYRHQNMFFYEKISQTIHINELDPLADEDNASCLDETEEHDIIDTHERKIFDYEDFND